MEFFTVVGVVVMTALALTTLYGIFYIIGGCNAFYGVVGFITLFTLIISILIMSPKSYGYQKITVSENAVEVSR